MNLAPILPEIILTIGAIVLMMVAAFLGKRIARRNCHAGFLSSIGGSCWNSQVSR